MVRVAVQLDNDAGDLPLQDFIQLVGVGRRLRQRFDLVPLSLRGAARTNSPIPISARKSPALRRFPSLFARRSWRNSAKPAFSSSSSNSSILSLAATKSTVGTNDAEPSWPLMAIRTTLLSRSGEGLRREEAFLTSCGKLRRASLVPSVPGFLSLAAATDQGYH